jgi:hypothetical protein
LREFELATGVASDGAYDLTMYILAATLVFGFFANQMVKPLADRWFMTDKEVAALQVGSSSVTSIPLDLSALVAALSMQEPSSSGPLSASQSFGAFGPRSKARWRCFADRPSSATVVRDDRTKIESTVNSHRAR